MMDVFKKANEAYNVYPAHTQPNRATNDSGFKWV